MDNSAPGISIRKIQPGDNNDLDVIVRSSLKEFGVDKPGTVYYDDTTDHLYELFQQPGSIYFVPTLWRKYAATAIVRMGTCALLYY